MSSENIPTEWLIRNILTVNGIISKAVDQLKSYKTISWYSLCNERVSNSFFPRIITEDHIFLIVLSFSAISSDKYIFNLGGCISNNKHRCFYAMEWICYFVHFDKIIVIILLKYLIISW